ncbi:MAG: thymidine phosphorylase [Spirochaetia bacterium]|jgi:pyrimidine-nucleoside phosphorylase|nr:thymidine phosphorylase [Spirochaetia bacterium]
MRAVDVIVKKRDGGELGEEEIRFLVQGYVGGDIPEYQVAAWLMAVFFRGMTGRETGILTREMIASGETLDLSGIGGPFVDKHSTGGVGDKVSLILAPLAASFGIRVPMMSGRSLGHTGGTLDKLEAIPGYGIARDAGEFRRVLRETGFVMAGQSGEMVPADRLLYALRDVTGTVESVPLITASILSKKFAEGARSFVFDVKCGSGAFMKNRGDAEALAESLIGAGRGLGRDVVCVVTDMDEPLGRMVGNFLEAEESALCLRGDTGGREDLMELTIRLGAWMLVLGGVSQGVEEARGLCLGMLSGGAPYRLFLKNIEAQGGDAGAFERAIGKRRAPLRVGLPSPASGYVAGIDAYSTGMAGVCLGAGRGKTGDPVFPDVGIVFHKKRGDAVSCGEGLCDIFARTEEAARLACARMEGAFRIAEAPPPPRSMIIKEYGTV